MAGIGSFLKKTLKRGTNVVRKVGRGTRKTLRRSTNFVGLTKRKGHKGHKGRKTHRRRQ